jgi:hypothetical protein
MHTSTFFLNCTGGIPVQLRKSVPVTFFKPVHFKTSVPINLLIYAECINNSLCTITGPTKICFFFFYSFSLLRWILHHLLDVNSKLNNHKSNERFYIICFRGTPIIANWQRGGEIVSHGYLTGENPVLISTLFFLSSLNTWKTIK